MTDADAFEAAMTLPVQETLRFLERALPPAPARVLEVGCGDGLVAAGLTRLGHHVHALDESPSPAAAATSAPVRWIDANFLYLDETPDRASYDVVLFTRSLHHISPLERAVERAAALCAPGGRLVAEEFAFDRVDIRTAAWWYEAEAALVANGTLAKPDPAFSGIRNPLGRWRAEHTHEPPLATGKGMLTAIRSRFDLGPAEEAPYLDRYARDRMAPGPEAELAVRELFEAEARLIGERAIAAAGLRIVAMLPTHGAHGQGPEPE